MIPPDHQSGTYEEASRLAERVRRNRRRTLRILTVAILVAVLWPVYVEYRMRQTAVPKFSYIKPVIGPRLPPRPASPDAKRKRVYSYSVIPGGVYSGAALALALARDPIAAAHYAGFNVAAARLVPAARGLRLYASYRIGDHIFWTAKPIALHENEALLTDGVHLARARCGNRLSEMPRTPVGPQVVLDSTEADDSAAQWRDSDPEDRGNPPVSSYPMSKVTHDMFPDVFVDYDGSLTIGAAAAAAQLSDGSVVSDGNETLSGYATPRPAGTPGESAPGLGWWLGGGVPIAGESIAPGGSGTVLVMPLFPGPGTSSVFTNSWQANLLPWPAIVPAAAASVTTAERSQPWPDSPPLPYSAPDPSPGPDQGVHEDGWGPFNLIVSGIAAAERGVVSGAHGGVEEGGVAGGDGSASGDGSLFPAGFQDAPAIGSTVPQPDGLALVALGLALFTLGRVRR